LAASYSPSRSKCEFSVLLFVTRCSFFFVRNPNEVFPMFTLFICGHLIHSSFFLSPPLPSFFAQARRSSFSPPLSGSPTTTLLLIICSQCLFFHTFFPHSCNLLRAFVASCRVWLSPEGFPFWQKRSSSPFRTLFFTIAYTRLDFCQYTL